MDQLHDDRGASVDVGGARGRSARLAPVYLLLILTLLAAGIVTAGYFYYRSFERSHRAEVERQLVAVADLKVSQLVEWRRQRLGDATVFLGNAAFSSLVQQLTARAGDAAWAREQLGSWLGNVQRGYQYDRVFFMDDTEAVLVSAPEGTQPVPAIVRTAAAEGLRSNEVRIVDFYRDDADQRIYLAVLVPVFTQAGGAPLGTLVLRVDPWPYLYPYIQTWPTPSPTAETLLVRRDGNDALYLNELKFQKDTALSLRIPLTRTEFPGVKAALGETGIVEGTDYRGVEVVADVQGVPGSPWFIVARIDAAEVYAPVRERLWVMVVLVAALLIGAGAGVGLIWRQQSTRVFREKYQAAEALRESERRFRTLFENLAEGVALHELVLDASGAAVDYRVLDVNPSYEKQTGISAERGRGALATRLYGVETPPYLEEYERVARGGGPFVFETYFPPLEKHFRISVISPNAGQFATVFEDITEWKRRERELEDKNAELERFSYTVSHDLRSPLVTIKTFLGYLSQDLKSADAGRIEKDLLYMHGAADKMGQLLDELLEMSRIGRISNPPSEVSFSQLVREAVDMLAGPITERGVDVRIGDEDPGSWRSGRI
jgi:signal transduction histidine kinase